MAYAVDGSNKDPVGDGVGALHGAPGVVLWGTVLFFFRGVPADGGGEEEDFGTLEGRHARGFGVPLVPADEGAYFALAGRQGLETEIARGEVELLVVEGVVGDVHLAVGSGDRVFSFGLVVEDGGGVVVEAGGSALKEAGNEDDLFFADYGREALGARAGDGFCEGEEGVVFALAEVLGGEELGEADEVGSGTGGFVYAVGGLIEVLGGGGGHGHLDKADDFFRYCHGAELSAALDLEGMCQLRLFHAEDGEAMNAGAWIVVIEPGGQPERYDLAMMIRVRMGLGLMAGCFFFAGNANGLLAQGTWVGTWAASQQIPEPQNALSPEMLTDLTLRQLVHLSIGGRRLRVHVSNAFGTTALHVDAVHVARPVSTSAAAVKGGTDRILKFAGKTSVDIPPGAEYLSDALEDAVGAETDLAITMHLAQVRGGQTGHPGSRATSYVSHGDLVSASDLPGATKVEHWYFLSGVDVEAGAEGSVVALGDSITDGHGATTNGNDRWPDVLGRRLAGLPAVGAWGMLNEGIGGNHLLTDGSGPNVLARFDRDVLAQAGVRCVIVLEGVNDLGGLARNGEVAASEHDFLVERLLGAYEQVVARAHAHGIRVIGGTILPYTGSDYYHPGPMSEADRLKVNAWIRAGGHFDAVIDFDKTMRDPAHAERLLPQYDSGDHLHPSAAGYRAMAESIPLALLTR